MTLFWSVGLLILAGLAVLAGTAGLGRLVGARGGPGPRRPARGLRPAAAQALGAAQLPGAGPPALPDGVRCGPELQQYFIERNFDGRPYDRDTRSVIYQRAKGIAGEEAFGTERDVNAVGYEYVVHSTAPLRPAEGSAREVRIGGPDCTQPYDMALLNVSAMSFGALSGNALRALNSGAAAGGFAHDTGEGGLTDHHLAGGGDLIWEIGSGYFGARTKDGDFDPDLFADKAAHPRSSCVSLKLSQGAKPGHRRGAARPRR